MQEALYWATCCCSATNSWCSLTYKSTILSNFALWEKLVCQSTVTFKSFYPFSTQPHQNCRVFWHPNFCLKAKLIGMGHTYVSYTTPAIIYGTFSVAKIYSRLHLLLSAVCRLLSVEDYFDYYWVRSSAKKRVFTHRGPEMLSRFCKKYAFFIDF